MTNEIEEILAYLDYIRSQNRLITLVHTFKGVSFSLSVNIVELSPKDRSCTISTHHRENISLLPNIQVVVHCDLFPFGVNAIVVSVDSQRKNAVLRCLDYEMDRDENRSQIRYQPHNHVPINILLEGGRHYSAQVHDMSIAGISIVLDQAPEDIETVFQAGKTSRISFSGKLADAPAEHVFNIPAKIIYANPVEEVGYRIGMQIFPTINDQNLLRQYIFDRQTELFRQFSPPGE